MVTWCAATRGDAVPDRVAIQPPRHGDLVIHHGLVHRAVGAGPFIWGTRCGSLDSRYTVVWFDLDFAALRVVTCLACARYAR